MAKFAKQGYGQVEPNRLTGIVTGNMESQAPAIDAATGNDKPIKQLENGMFLCIKRDEAGVAPLGRVAVLPGKAEATATPYLVFSEKKLYDERSGYSDFVAKSEDQVDGFIYPRLVALEPDTCVFTTNTVDANAGSLSAGDKLYVADNGYLNRVVGKNTRLMFEVIQVTTLPDGQEAVKLLTRVRA